MCGPILSLPKALAGLAISLCLSAGLSALAQQVDVPANLSAGPPLVAPGGSLKGEYWKRTPVSIAIDGRANRNNGIDRQIQTFGPPTGTFTATLLNYTGNDLTPVATWLGSDSAMYVGVNSNLDDGAFRFSGFINVPAAGVVSLGLTSDDGSRITIGGLDIAERDGSHADETQDIDANFLAAGLYPIEVTFFNGDWTSDSLPAPAPPNHSGNPDGGVHGGANFHLRVGAANVTATEMAMFHPEAPAPQGGLTIGLNFGADEYPTLPNTGTLPAATVAGVVPQANWNNLTLANGSASGLIGDAGGSASATSVSVTWTSPNTWSTTGRGEENSGFAPGGDRTLMTGYLDTTDAAAGVATVTVSGLGPSFTGAGYDVIVYALGGVAGRGGAYSIGSLTNFGTGPANPTVHALDAGVDHTDTGTYMRFSGLTSSSFTLIANAEAGVGFGTTRRAPVNAIQIIGGGQLGNTAHLGRNKIGTVADNGGGSFTIVGGGNDIWDNVDEFTYAYERVTGNFDVKVRVESITPNARWSKAGIMVRESLAEDSRMLFPRVTPLDVPTGNGGNGANDNGFSYRTGRHEPTAAFGDDHNGGRHEDGLVPYAANQWVRLQRVGSVFTSYYSPDGVTWTAHGTQDTTMGDWVFSPNNSGPFANTVLVGLGVSRHSAAPTATAEFRSFQLTLGGSGDFNVIGAASRGNPTGVRVEFSKPVGEGSLVAANYTLNNGATVVSAGPGPNSSSVQLLLAAPLTEGTLYSVSVFDVKSAGGEDMNANETTFTHGTGYGPRAIKISRNMIPGGSLELYTNSLAYQMDLPVASQDLPPVAGNNVFEDVTPETGDGREENYSARISGLFTPTATGEHRFYVAADDQAVVFLSTDDDPANKVAIAREPEWNGRRDYNTLDRRPGDPRPNWSLPISLTAGQKYYLECIYAEGGGGNHAAVAFSGPGGSPPANGDSPIPESMFMPSRMFAGSVFNNLGAVTIIRQPTDKSVVAPAAVTFQVRADGTPRFTYQWRRNGENIPGANGHTYTIPVSLPSDHNAVFSVQVANEFSSAISANARLTVLSATAPHLVSVSPGTSLTSATARFDNLMDLVTAQNAANYTIAGLTVSSATLDASGSNVVLVTSAQAPGTSYTLTVRDVRERTGTSVLSPNPSTGTFTTFAFGAGGITFNRYDAIGGGVLVSDLTSNPKFPSLPDFTEERNSFEAPDNDGGDNLNEYGAQIIGFVHPPVTGPYVFAVAADDQAILYLSTDATPGNKVQIAQEPIWAAFRNYAGAADGGGRVCPGAACNISDPINLVAGQKYYIEGLYKEGIGGDFMSVTWQTPAGGPQTGPIVDGLAPIPGAFLSPIGDVPPPVVFPWAVGLDDNAWPVGDGGGANASFVQENGVINPLPGSPTSPEVNQQADNDYYFAGSYTTVIAGNGAYAPVGVVPVNEEAAERAFAAADNDLRYHFNLPTSLGPSDSLSVTFDALNLDDPNAVNTNPRYGIEVYFNGVLVQPQIVIGPAQLGVDYTTPAFTLASVNAQVGPGADNIVSLRGINYNTEGGGNWMGIDYVQLNRAAAPPAPSVEVPAASAISAPRGGAGGSLNGEYWQRPVFSILTDGNNNRANGVDNQIKGFGPASGRFAATQFVYLGNDLTGVPTPWLGPDAASFVGTPGNLDDGAFRFSGYINVVSPGMVRIGTLSDDGSRIAIGGVDIINNDGGHGDATVDTNVNFTAAGLYPVEITYFNGDWTSDSAPAPAPPNHSGNPDPGVHGGANFRLRVNGADITAAQTALLHPGLIIRVIETGGDNEATDTIPAKWTGQTFPVSVANEPVPGLVIGNNFTVGLFGNHSPTFVDRNHRYTNASDTVLIPTYLAGGEYVMNGNDNRDNATMTMDVTVARPVTVYLLIDNRLGDPNSPNTDPPTFGPTKMQWVLDEAWTPVTTGNNRTGDMNVPDEVGIDEGSDGTINQWYSVYSKNYPAGTFRLKQADNAGQNMYGAVVKPAAGPAPVGYAATILAEGPIAYWRFNEAAPPTAENSGTLGPAANGTYQGNAAPGAEAPRFPGFESNNTALQLDGNGDYVGTVSGLLNDIPVFTISGWIRRATDQVNRTGIWGQNDLVEFGYIDNNTLQAWTDNGLNVTPNPFPNGQWSHLALISDGPNITIYTNGQPAGTRAHTLPANNTFPFNIGGGGVFDAIGANGNYFNGQIDEVAIYNKALSAAQIAQQYSSGFCSALTGTATIGRFDGCPDTPITLQTFGGAGGASIQTTDGNPGGYLRLTDAINDQLNFAAFDRTASGPLPSSTFNFQFRLQTVATPSADGFSFSYANTATYNVTGNIPGPPAPFTPEDPAAAGILGFGFDTWSNGAPNDNPGVPTGSDYQEISLFYNGALIQRIDNTRLLATPLTLDDGAWHTVSGVVNFAGGTVSMNVDGNPIFVNLAVAGLAPFESRIVLAARTGGENERACVDNLNVQWSDVAPLPGDVTQPGDPIQLVNGTNDGDAASGPPPAGEIVEHAIDNVGQKYLNFLDLGSGLAVRPALGPTLVTGLRLYTANDAPERDPASYLLEGSIAGFDGPWTTISSGDLALPAGRNPGGLATPLGTNSQTLTFPNSAVYIAYRLTFPTLKNAATANSMQISEIELLGVASVLDVTQPGDPIAVVNGTNDGDANSGAPPAAEGVAQSIDNVGQKYLNFLDLGSGLAVQPRLGPTLVTGLRLYSANDAPERDPASYLLEGSLTGLDGPWSSIAGGPLALPTGRNPGGNTTPLGTNFQQLSFPNTAVYVAYRLTFPTLRNAATANSMQISEVELLGAPGVLPPMNPHLVSCASSLCEANVLRVIYDRPVALDGTYTLDGGLSQSSNRRYGASMAEVLLDLDLDTSLATHSVQISDVTSLGGATIDPNPSTCSFTLGLARFAADFNDGQLPPGTTSSGTTPPIVVDGSLHLTELGVLSNQNFWTIDFGGTLIVDRLQASWKTLLNGLGQADGFSFNVGQGPFTYQNGIAEEGGNNGLSVCVDTFDNGDIEVPDIGIEINWNGARLAFTQAAAAGQHGPPSLMKNMFVDASVEVTPSGAVTFNYDNFTASAQIPSFTGITANRYEFGARTGGAAEACWIDDVRINDFNPGPPTIGGGPNDATVPQNNTATFAVTGVNGVQPISYQWLRNGVVIAGATGPVLSLTATAADNGAKFSVRLANECGMITSREATLTVVVAPVVLSCSSRGNCHAIYLTYNKPVQLDGTYTVSGGVTVSGVSHGDSPSIVVLRVTPDLTADSSYTVTITGVHDADGALIAPNPSTCQFVHGSEYPLFRVLFKRFDGIGGVALAPLYADARFPNNPSATQVDPTAFFEAPRDVGTDFGAQISGIAIAPVEGDYRFWISADDNAELYLSTDTNPANKVRIAVEPEWAGHREFTEAHPGTAPVNGNRGTPPVNGSAPIHLLAGQRIYLEGNYKEAGGGDNFAVAATINDPNPPANGADPIAASFFAPRRRAPGGEIFTQLCDVFCNPGPSDQTVFIGQSATFSVTPDGTPPYTFQWKKNGANIAGATGASYITPPATEGDEGAVFSVSVGNAFSSNSCSAVLHVRLEPRVVACSVPCQADEIVIEYNKPVQLDGTYTVSGRTVTGVAYGGSQSIVVLTVSPALALGSSVNVTIMGVHAVSPATALLDPNPTTCPATFGPHRLCADFEGGATPVTLQTFNLAPGPTIETTGGNPGGYLRLTDAINDQNNFASFDRTAPGPLPVSTFSFQFRLATVGTPSADGFSFSYANTANYGASGALPGAAPFTPEDPSAAGILGFGFDTWSNGAPNDNPAVGTGSDYQEISLFYNGTLIRRINDTRLLTPALTLDDGNWHTVTGVVNFAGGTVSMSVDGSPIFANEVVAGLVPFESRIVLAARTGGENEIAGIDNLCINDFVPPDLAGPILSCPNVTVPCTTPASTPVNYSVSAVDLCDGAVVASCTPPSGSSFPTGATTVSCTASDSAGNQSQCSFTVTVTEPCGGNVCPDAKALVASCWIGNLSEGDHYTVISVNGVDTEVTLDGSMSSDPDNDPLTYLWSVDQVAAGTTAIVKPDLDLGNHEAVLSVNDGACTATDTISVEVITACDAVEELAQCVELSGLDRKKQKPLTQKLKEACKEYDKAAAYYQKELNKGHPDHAAKKLNDHLKHAIKKLEDFQKKVEQELKKRRISAAMAEKLIGFAQEIIDCTDPVEEPDGNKEDNCGGKGKPNVLVLRYNGNSCAESQNSQGNKSTCSGDPNGAAEVGIAVKGTSNPLGASYFVGRVQLGQSFTVDAAAAGEEKLGGKTYFFIYTPDGRTLLQTVQIDTSCSVPLTRGESFGSIGLVDYTLED